MPVETRRGPGGGYRWLLALAAAAAVYGGRGDCYSAGFIGDATGREVELLQRR